MSSTHGTRARLSPRWRFRGLVALAVLAFVAVWLTTADASLTHDEVVYLDVADHPFTSSFYPGDTFLRHPPLGLAFLSAWTAIGLPLRVWSLVWTLGGLGVLADAIHRRDGSPLWLFPVVLAAPVTIPLVTVTMYPTLFFFLAVAAWGWAARRRDAEVVGWNLAVFTHELALLLLAVLLATRAARFVRERRSDLRDWAGLVWPYPAAIAWGTVMVVNLLAGDARGGYLASITDPSPNVAAILGLKPWAGLVILLTALPYLAVAAREASDRDAGLLAATLVAALTAPFYRYLVPLMPALAVTRADGPPAWWKRWGPAPLVVAALLATGLALGATVTGHDTLNAGNTPGLVDHREARELVEPGEHVVVRSSPSFAHVLAADGWRIEATAPTGPATVELARGDERIVLHRAETYQRLEEIDRIDALVFPSSWTNVEEEAPRGPWTPVAERGGMTRWEPRSTDEA